MFLRICLAREAYGISLAWYSPLIKLAGAYSALKAEEWAEWDRLNAEWQACRAGEISEHFRGCPPCRLLQHVVHSLSNSPKLLTFALLFR
jgi:hypothetical protein